MAGNSGYWSGFKTNVGPWFRHPTAVPRIIFGRSTIGGLDSFVLVMFYSEDDRSPRKLAHADPEEDGQAGCYGRQGAPQHTDAGPGRTHASRILGIRP